MVGRILLFVCLSVSVFVFVEKFLNSKASEKFSRTSALSLPSLTDLIQNDHWNIKQMLSVHKPIGHLPLMCQIDWEIDIEIKYGSRYLFSLMGKRNWTTRLFWLSSPPKSGPQLGTGLQEELDWGHGCHGLNCSLHLPGGDVWPGQQQQRGERV